MDQLKESLKNAEALDNCDHRPLENCKRLKLRCRDDFVNAIFVYPD